MQRWWDELFLFHLSKLCRIRMQKRWCGDPSSHRLCEEQRVQKIGCTKLNDVYCGRRFVKSTLMLEPQKNSFNLSSKVQSTNTEFLIHCWLILLDVLQLFKDSCVTTSPGNSSEQCFTYLSGWRARSRINLSYNKAVSPIQVTARSIMVS